MADVFISYSQGAPEPTQQLAADLTEKRYAATFKKPDVIAKALDVV